MSLTSSRLFSKTNLVSILVAKKFNYCCSVSRTPILNLNASQSLNSALICFDMWLRSSSEGLESKFSLASLSNSSGTTAFLSYSLHRSDNLRVLRIILASRSNDSIANTWSTRCVNWASKASALCMTGRSSSDRHKRRISSCRSYAFSNRNRKTSASLTNSFTSVDFLPSVCTESFVPFFWLRNSTKATRHAMIAV